jgi:hypothetical protein
MNNNIRIVKFNEDIFKIPSKTQKRKKPDKPIKIKNSNGKKVSDKTIKNKILNEIRNNQRKLLNESTGEDTIVGSKSSATTDFEKDFQSSVEYMAKLADKHKETAKLNKTIKSHNDTFSSMPSTIDGTNLSIDSMNNNSMYPSSQTTFGTPSTFGTQSSFSSNIFQPTENTNLIPVQLDLNESYSQDSYSPDSYAAKSYAPPITLQNQPMYGCLKNGSLPTYRSYYNKTVRNGQITSLEPPATGASPITITDRIKSPAELLLLTKEKEKKGGNKKKINKRIKKLVRRTHRIGKDKYRPRVGVLLPNKTIRNNVTTQSYLLKQTPIDEIRKKLVKSGFIKVGSSAPNDVLRQMYESIFMIGGDVNNHNPDNLLYNFFNEK